MLLLNTIIIMFVFWKLELIIIKVGTIDANMSSIIFTIQKCKQKILLSLYHKIIGIYIFITDILFKKLRNLHK